MENGNKTYIKIVLNKLLNSSFILLLFIYASISHAQIGIKLELDACVKNDTLFIDIFASDTLSGGTAFAFGGANFVIDIVHPSGATTSSILWGDQIKIDSLDGPWDDSGFPNTDTADYYDMTLNRSDFLNLTIVPDESDNLGGGTNLGFIMVDNQIYNVGQVAIPMAGNCGDTVSLRWRTNGFGSGTMTQWNGIGIDIRPFISFHNLENVLLCNNICASSTLAIEGTDSLCFNGLGTFSVPLATNGDSISWFVNDNLMQNNITNSFQTTFNTLDTIRAEIVNNACSNCPKSITDLFIIQNINPPITVNTVEDTLDVKIGNAVQIFITDTNGNSYSWFPIDGLLDSFIQNPFASPLDTTNYVVTVFGLDTNCFALDTVVVNVIPNDFEDLIIRNFFSPNGDTKNDFWTVNDITIIEGCKVEVYSRWGIQIFESSNYQNDWGGQTKGKNVPDGTYFYVIMCDEFEQTGAITLKR